ncbi:MAG: PDZ domain-containing protein [Ginsengibacter sp.]
MKTIFKAAIFTICCGLLSSVGLAQKEPSKIKKNEEIIIRKNDDSPGKTIIEIDSNNITVNGKPLSEYNGDVSVFKRNYMSPGENNFFQFPQGNINMTTNTNTAFLGVLTSKTDKGVVVKNVIDSSAAKNAGLQTDDIITKFGDKEISSPEDLRNAVGNYKPGDKVTVNYLRNGKNNSAEVTLTKSIGNANVYGMQRFDDMMNSMSPNRNFNFKMMPMPRNNFGFNNNNQPKLGLKIEDTKDDTGARVLDVTQGSAAEKAGLKSGDIITEVNGEKVKGVGDIRNEMMNADSKYDYNFKVKRDKNEKSFEIKIPKNLKKIDI